MITFVHQVYKLVDAEEKALEKCCKMLVLSSGKYFKMLNIRLLSFQNQFSPDFVTIVMLKHPIIQSDLNSTERHLSLVA